MFVFSTKRYTSIGIDSIIKTLGTAKLDFIKKSSSAWPNSTPSRFEITHSALL